MMWWNGSWTWLWIAMMPVMAPMWALIALVLVPLARNGRDRPPFPRERLDDASPPVRSAWRSTAPGGPSSTIAEQARHA